MKKKLLSVVLCAVLALAVLPTGALAEDYTVDQLGTVRFTRTNGEDQLVSSFTSEDVYSPLEQLQPGDSVTMTVTLSNEHPETVDFYMSTEVLRSMEESETNAQRTIGGGGYTYELTYRGPQGEQALYRSDTIGGEDGMGTGSVGLHQAAEWSDEFGYLDTLATGESGALVLKVSLDGATQTNNYQDTLARLQMRFATVLASSPTGTPDKDVVTGDETNLELYLGISGVSGILVLALAVYAWWFGRKEKRTEGGK